MGIRIAMVLGMGTVREGEGEVRESGAGDGGICKRFRDGNGWGCNESWVRIG